MLAEALNKGEKSERIPLDGNYKFKLRTQNSTDGKKEIKMVTQL